MERRKFLGMMLAGAGTAALGGAVGAAAPEQASQADPKREVSPSEPTTGRTAAKEREVSPEVALVAYCGKFCGKCALCAFNVGLGVNALKKVNDTIAIGKAVDMIGFPPIHDMANHCCAGFDRELASFAELGKLAFPPGCRNGCAPCEIRECCKQKGYLTCAECDQTANCKKLDKPIKEGADIHANQKGIREMGLEKWAKKQFAEAVSEKKAALHKAIDEAF